MASRISPFSLYRTIVLRPRPQLIQDNLRQPLTRPWIAKYSTNDETPKTPTSDPIPSITEETAATKEIQGEKPPEVEQGTPVQETIKQDKDIQDTISNPANKPDSNAANTSSFEDSIFENPAELNAILDKIPEEWHVGPLPPLRPEDTMSRRYPAIVEQFVGLIMRHGKKSVAQTNVSLILNHLRTSPPPSLNPSRPLIPGHPPSTFLPLNPLIYFTLAVDSIAPMIRLRQLKGQLGGGQSLPVPSPLSIRQRRRTAIMWILDAASKKPNRVSGKGTFALRVAQELVGVVEGKSSLWERRINVHKQAVAARANVNAKRRKKGKPV